MCPPRIQTNPAYTAAALVIGCYSARRPVILKLLRAQSYGPRDARRIKKEYEVGRDIASSAIVRPLALETYDGVPTLVLEDVGGVSVDQLLQAGQRIPVDEPLAIAIGTANAVAEIHGLGKSSDE